MDGLWNLWRREPAALIGALRAILVAVAGFGLDLSVQQITLVILAFEAVLTVLTRTAVYSPATVAQIRSDGATKVLEAAQGLVVTDVPMVVAESLNTVTDVLEPPAPEGEVGDERPTGQL